MPFLTQAKTNWKFLLIVVVLAVVVGGGIWIYAQMTEKEFEVPLTDIPERVSGDETADWQTYRNEKYGFEMKYPKDWRQYDLEQYKSGIRFVANNYLGSFFIYVVDIQEEKELKDYLKEDFEKDFSKRELTMGVSTIIDQEETELLGLLVIQREEFLAIQRGEFMVVKYSILATYLKNNNLMFKFIFYGRGPLSNFYYVTEEDRKLNDQILSTLRFIEPKHEAKEEFKKEEAFYARTIEAIGDIKGVAHYTWIGKEISFIDSEGSIIATKKESGEEIKKIENFLKGKIIVNKEAIESPAGIFYYVTAVEEACGATGNCSWYINRFNSMNNETVILKDFFGHSSYFDFSPDNKKALLRYCSNAGLSSVGCDILVINLEKGVINSIEIPKDEEYTKYTINFFKWINNDCFRFDFSQEDFSFSFPERKSPHKILYIEYCLSEEKAKIINEIFPPPVMACLAKGIKITMADNSHKNIEDVKKGDFVKSFDVEIWEIKSSEVIEVIERTDPIININNKIKAAPDHPIYLSDGSIKPAGELKVGDLLFNNITVDSVDYSPVKVDAYDLILKDAVNFFAEDYLVGTPNKTDSLY